MAEQHYFWLKVENYPFSPVRSLLCKKEGCAHFILELFRGPGPSPIGTNREDQLDYIISKNAGKTVEFVNESILVSPKNSNEGGILPVSKS